MPSPETVFFALTGGILPALLWLWFWLQEDRLHPEPRGMLIRTFVAGMIAVPLVLPVEQKIQATFFLSPALVVFLLVVAEEIFKLGAAYFSALDTREYDEPIDAAIYLVTAALGFAAMENIFFMNNLISNQGLVTGLVNGNLRFIGATLLHVLSSGTIGLFIGLSYWKGWFGKKMALIWGIIMAILLHAGFNTYIMRVSSVNSSDELKKILIVFSFVWLAIILLIVGLEKVKQTQEKRL